MNRPKYVCFGGALLFLLASGFAGLVWVSGPLYGVSDWGEWGDWNATRWWWGAQNAGGGGGVGGGGSEVREESRIRVEGPSLDRADFNGGREKTRGTRSAQKPQQTKHELEDTPLLLLVSATQHADPSWRTETAETLHTHLAGTPCHNSSQACCVVGYQARVFLRVIYCEHPPSQQSSVQTRGDLPPHTPFDRGVLLLNPALEEHGAAFEISTEVLKMCRGVLREKVQRFFSVVVNGLEFRGAMSREVQHALWLMDNYNDSVCVFSSEL